MIDTLTELLPKPLFPPVEVEVCPACDYPNPIDGMPYECLKCGLEPVEAQRRANRAGLDE